MDQAIYDQLELLYRNTCVLCLEPANHPHHVLPKSAGGEDTLDNIVPLCYSCHRFVHDTGAQNHVERIKEKAETLRNFYKE